MSDYSSDDNAAGSHKSKKQKRLRLIDDMAADEDAEGEDLDYINDDEEEGDDGDENDEEMQQFIANDEDEDNNSDEEKVDYSTLTPDELKALKKLRKQKKREKKKKQRAAEFTYADFDRERDEAERADIEAKLRERYGADADGEIGDDGEPTDIAEEDDYQNFEAGQTVLPSVADPKLFLVKCDPGKEDESVIALVKRFAVKQDSKDDRLFIHSAFCTPAAHGYIYIEADKEIHVKKAIAGIRTLKAYKCILVPLKEMVSALTFTDNTKQVDIKQWVRIKTGLYKNDLGQVVNVSDHGTRLTVKLVPRIDLVALEDAMRSGATPGGPKRKRNQVRPAAKLFDPNEIQQLGGIVTRKQGALTDDIRNYNFFAGNRYKHGFLYKDFGINGVQADAVAPQPDELERFKDRRRDAGDRSDRDGTGASELTNEEIDTEIDRATNQLATGARVTTVKGGKKGASSGTLALNDRVIVTSGGTRNIVGRIVTINNDSLTIQPDPDQPIQITLDLTFNQVRKYWHVGDHVKVIAGPHLHETGLITQVRESDGTVSLFSDSTMRELSANSGDLMETTEVHAGQESLGQYELYDLVQLAGDVVGCIVKVEVNTLKILTHRGTIETAKLSDIVRKKDNKFAAGLDANGNQMVVKDIVTVLQGQYQGKQGTIRHLYRNICFLHSRSVAQETSGIFVVPGKHVVHVGATPAPMQKRGLAGRPRSPPRTVIATPFGQVPAANSAAMPAPKQPFRPGMSGRGAKQFDPLFNQTVTITGGPYKGYAGRVVDVTDAQARVELSAITRTLQIPRKYIAIRQATAAPTQTTSGGYSSYGAGSQTPLIGSKTPAYDASRTPAYGGFGGATPAHFGSATPSRDVWAAQTPAHSLNDADDLPEDSDELDLEQQMMSISQNYTQPSASSRYPPTTPKYEDDSSNNYAESSAASTSLSAAVDALDDDEAVILPENGRVTVTTEGDKAGTITTVNADGSAVVKLDSGSNVTVTPTDIKPVAISKHDSVAIIKGANRKQQGTLVGINGDEAIVQVEDDIVILPLDTLIKLVT